MILVLQALGIAAAIVFGAFLGLFAICLLIAGIAELAAGKDTSNDNPPKRKP